jgi:3-hydroxyisobutyrate dehydrogenase-like beta-hydroxyacid dehydrogenase
MQIALIGYGEVGCILAEDLRAAGHSVAAFDRKLAHDDGKESGDAMRAHAAKIEVNLGATVADALRGAELVISAVTASQAVPVAQACAFAMANGMGRGAFVLDFNSASPRAKMRAAALVDAVGGRYVEGAVMTTLPPYRIKVPLLLGGPHANALLPVLLGLGFAPKVVSEKLGVASATKMCRSIVIKGLEAMVIESFTTARHYGVEDAVIASLYETYPGIDWDKQGAYLFQRVIEHGRRRSEEVMEVAQTVSEAGLSPYSATGTAQRQAQMADWADDGVFGVKGVKGTNGVNGVNGKEGFARSADWRTEADRLLSHAHRPTVQPAKKV